MTAQNLPGLDSVTFIDANALQVSGHFREKRRFVKADDIARQGDGARDLAMLRMYHHDRGRHRIPYRSRGRRTIATGGHSQRDYGKSRNPLPHRFTSKRE